MTVRAASCEAGLTPAQQAASTEMGSSGIAALSSSAFDTTQISVHRPTSSTDSSPPDSYSAFSSSTSASLPKVGFSTALAPRL